MDDFRTFAYTRSGGAQSVDRTRTHTHIYNSANTRSVPLKPLRVEYICRGKYNNIIRYVQIFEISRNTLLRERLHTHTFINTSHITYNRAIAIYTVCRQKLSSLLYTSGAVGVIIRLGDRLQLIRDYGGKRVYFDSATDISIEPRNNRCAYTYILYINK